MTLRLTVRVVNVHVGGAARVFDRKDSRAPDSGDHCVKDQGLYVAAEIYALAAVTHP